MTICAVLAACAAPAHTVQSAAATPSNSRTGPVIHLEDVYRFYEIYDAAGGNPSAGLLQREYLDAGSAGLHRFAELRNITGAAIAAAIARKPEIYSSARRCVDALPRVRQRLEAALHELSRRYPAANLPPVTIAVGRGKPIGIGYPDSGIQIGLEALCAISYFNPDLEDRFVYVIAHEYIHVQQSPELADDEHPTVLEVSLGEGAAEFVAELIAGDVSYSHLRALTAGREMEIETAFAADKDKTDLSDWLYNATLDKPGDLGYWVGYRIVKSYYQRADDKRRALREILEMTDAKAFLAASGWYPGIRLK